MKYLLIITVLILVGQIAGKIAKVRKSDRRQDDSFNINVSAGYGVQNDNQMANSEATNEIKDNNDVHISTVYAVPANPDTMERMEPQNSEDNNSQATETRLGPIYAIQTNQNEENSNIIQTDNNLQHKFENEAPPDNQLGPTYVIRGPQENDVPSAQLLVSAAEEDFQPSDPQGEYVASAQDNPKDNAQSASLVLGGHEVPSQQVLETLNDNTQAQYGESHSFSSSEGFAALENLRSNQNAFKENSMYQVNEPQDLYDSKLFERPDLSIQNAFVNEAPHQRSKSPKYVQVLKVPAVYEIHLQSEGPSVDEQFVNIRNDERTQATSYQNFNKYPSGHQPIKYIPSSNNMGDFDSNHYTKVYSSDQEFNSKFNHNSNGHGPTMGSDGYKFQSPPAYFSPANKFEHPMKGHSHVSIKHHHHHPATPVYYKKPQPPSVVHIPRPHKPTQPSKPDYDSYNFNEYDFYQDMKKPQALHEVPAPTLAEKHVAQHHFHHPKPQYTLHDNQNELVSAPQPLTYEPSQFHKQTAFKPEPQHYQEIHSTLKNHRPIYGKQIEAVKAPQSFQKTQPQRPSPRKPQTMSKIVRQKIIPFKTISEVLSENDSPQSQALTQFSGGNKELDTSSFSDGLGLYYSGGGPLGQESNVQSPKYEDLMQAAYMDQKMKASNPPPKELVYGQRINQYPKWKGPKEMQAFMKKINGRNVRKQRRNDITPMDYVLYIKEETLD